MKFIDKLNFDNLPKSNLNLNSQDLFFNQIKTLIIQDENELTKNKKKIEDLESQIKKQQDEITLIKDQNIKNWQAEKITVIHNINQEYLTNLTYKNKFEYGWKYDVMKLILVNLLKNTFHLDEKVIIVNDINIKAAYCREKIMELFKKKCFKSAKLKNLLLNVENFKIDLDNSYNVYDENSPFHYKQFFNSLDEKTRKKYLEQNKEFMDLNISYKYFHYVKNKIYQIHEIEIKNKNKEFINVWIPLLCTIQEVLALSIANDRIKDKRINIIEKVKN